MSADRIRAARPVAVLAVSAVLLAAACRHAAPVVAPPPVLSAEQPMSVTTEVTTTTTSPAVVPDTAPEHLVTITGEMDVRQALAYLAEQGKLNLIVSPDVDKKVRLQLTNVPVSQALKAVLDAAGLTLENMNAPKAPEHTSSVVFYQLPANVDSLSVEAIMKRFGIGRTAAEVIVNARTVKP
ncbi:MAG TPA: hypothetical protein VGM67_11880 [Gemmatimonadaceae bacterium]|jgi:hypothetical protein